MATGRRYCTCREAHKELVRLAVERAEANASNARKLERRLDFQLARGMTMGKVIELLRPVIVAIEGRVALTAEQKARAVDTLDQAIIEVLTAVSREIEAFYSERHGLGLNCNVMFGL